MNNYDEYKLLAHDELYILVIILFCIIVRIACIVVFTSCTHSNHKPNLGNEEEPVYDDAKEEPQGDAKWSMDNIPNIRDST